jgi:hypothetical protein
MNQSKASTLVAPVPMWLTLAGDAVRQIRRSKTRATLADRRALDDFQRRPSLQLKHVADISRSCTSVADALALPEMLRSYILAGRLDASNGTIAALRAERDADAAEDLAVFEYLANPSPGTRAAAIEALRAQELASRAAADALHVGDLPRLSLVRTNDVGD